MTTRRTSIYGIGGSGYSRFIEPRYKHILVVCVAIDPNPVGQNVVFGSLLFSTRFNVSRPKRCSRHEACSREGIPGTGAAYSAGFNGLLQKHEALTNASRSELLPQEYGIGLFHQ
jgi:hypothetical protein